MVSRPLGLSLREVASALDARPNPNQPDRAAPTRDHGGYGAAARALLGRQLHRSFGCISDATRAATGHRSRPSPALGKRVRCRGAGRRLTLGGVLQPVGQRRERRPPPPAPCRPGTRWPRPRRGRSPAGRAAGRAASSPAGTERPGRPARLTVTVNTSLRYIATGSSILSPARNGPEGAVGVSSASTRSNAWLKSSTMRRRTFCALQVVGVVVAGREHVGADQDAALDLGAEALRRGVFM